MHRRALLRAALGVAGGAALPGWARAESTGAGTGELAGETIALEVRPAHLRIGGRATHAVTVNGTMPGPLIRLREGQRVRFSVTNRLAEETSIHWHGLILPFQYDGVPGISFPGIAPGETFVAEFDVRQAGTYWYHGHSNMQEAMGLFGPIVIDPATPDPARADREHVLMLSDWSGRHPHALLRRLKQSAGAFNYQKQTLAGLAAGRDQPAAERLRWGAMRMDPTDLSDVTGAAYRYLVNGRDTAENWTGLFAPGEAVRLRVINASAMTNFNLRIPGLPLSVVQADGQDVVPVEVDELQIGVAETYDVIVRPPAAQPYAVVAEAVDRSGLCRATLSPGAGLVAPVPPLRPRPLLTMRDMGMDMGGGESGGAGGHAMHHGGAGMDHGGMKMRDAAAAPAGVRMGPGVAMLAAMPADRMADRPTGLTDAPHRVLTYADLKAAVPARDRRAPGRRLEIHLTANMERYMWSFDGVKLSEAPEPFAFRHGERVRLVLVNDTMMPHPIHLHGHFFELVNGAGERAPRKHTVNVLPGAKAELDLTADALGDWAFHCHMLLHMHSGMFRVVTVRHG